MSILRWFFSRVLFLLLLSFPRLMSKTYGKSARSDQIGHGLRPTPVSVSIELRFLSGADHNPTWKERVRDVLQSCGENTKLVGMVEERKSGCFQNHRLGPIGLITTSCSFSSWHWDIPMLFPPRPDSHEQCHAHLPFRLICPNHESLRPLIAAAGAHSNRWRKPSRQSRCTVGPFRNPEQGSDGQIVLDAVE